MLLLENCANNSVVLVAIINKNFVFILYSSLYIQPTEFIKIIEIFEKKSTDFEI